MKRALLTVASMVFATVISGFGAVALAEDELVEVPDDYKALDIPVGALFKPKADIVLHAGEQAVELKMSNGGDGTFKVKIVTTCMMYFEASERRRLVKAGTTFLLQETTVYPNTGEWSDPECWKDRESREGEGGISIAIASLGGFYLGGDCVTEMNWATGDWSDLTRCHHTGNPDAEDLKGLFELLAHPDDLVDVIQ